MIVEPMVAFNVCNSAAASAFTSTTVEDDPTCSVTFRVSDWPTSTVCCGILSAKIRSC